MRTAIYTVQEKTTLTIQTSEVVDLVQMGAEDNPIRLSPGRNEVMVGAGVFKVVSTEPVLVTADTTQFEVAFAKDKDDWPDPPKLIPNIDPVAFQAFFTDARSQPAPR